MLAKGDLHKYQEQFFNFTIVATYVLLIASFFGFSQSAPKYLADLDFYVKIYVALFLVWRFNPLRKSFEFTDLDRKIAFSAGVFVLTSSALSQYLLLKVQNVVQVKSA